MFGVAVAALASLLFSCFTLPWWPNLDRKQWNSARLVNTYHFFRQISSICIRKAARPIIFGVFIKKYVVNTLQVYTFAGWSCWLWGSGITWRHGVSSSSWACRSALAECCRRCGREVRSHARWNTCDLSKVAFFHRFGAGRLPLVS